MWIAFRIILLIILMSSGYVSLNNDFENSISSPLLTFLVSGLLFIFSFTVTAYLAK